MYGPAKHWEWSTAECSWGNFIELAHSADFNGNQQPDGILQFLQFGNP
jgi:hypothetical protein